MSQGIRDLLANRKFAIPLIVMLGICFVGLLLLGIVFIVKPSSKPAAQATPTTRAVVVQVTQTPMSTSVSPAQPTAAPTNTLVPIGTAVAFATATSPAAQAMATGEATVQPTEPGSGAAATGAEATSDPTAEGDELAQTGAGWGLIVASGAALALLFIVARRLRLAR